MTDTNTMATVLSDPLEASWRELAACTAHDPNLFFPVGDTGPALEQIAQAKQICAECPIKVECLTYAIESNQVNGVWGGTTEQERRLMRRRWLSARRRNDRAGMRKVFELP